MEKLANRRSFDYDVRSMLAYPPQENIPYNEVVLTISGLPGSGGGDGTWNGLGNGTHYLDGSEILTNYDHKWFFNSSGSSKPSNLRFSATSATQGAAWATYVWMSYNNSYDHIYVTGGTTQTPSISPLPGPSIQDHAFGRSLTVQGVTFTWNKGANWSRGNM